MGKVDNRDSTLQLQARLLLLGMKLAAGNYTSPRATNTDSNGLLLQILLYYYWSTNTSLISLALIPNWTGSDPLPTPFPLAKETKDFPLALGIASLDVEL